MFLLSPEMLAVTTSVALTSIGLLISYFVQPAGERRTETRRSRDNRMREQLERLHAINVRELQLRAGFSSLQDCGHTASIPASSALPSPLGAALEDYEVALGELERVDARMNLVFADFHAFCVRRDESSARSIWGNTNTQRAISCE